MPTKKKAKRRGCTVQPPPPPFPFSLFRCCPLRHRPVLLMTDMTSICIARVGVALGQGDAHPQGKNCVVSWLLVVDLRLAEAASGAPRGGSLPTAHPPSATCAELCVHAPSMAGGTDGSSRERESERAAAQRQVLAKHNPCATTRHGELSHPI
jgi:hypothetical protein